MDFPVPDKLALVLDAVAPDTQSEATNLYRLAQEAVRQGFLVSGRRHETTAWKQWNLFYQWLQILSTLDGIKDPVPFLQLFAKRVRSGVLAAGGKRLKKRTVEQYLRSVGQIFASVGSADPRHNALGDLGF